MTSRLNLLWLPIMMLRGSPDILGLPENAFCGADGTDPRREVLKDMTSIDVSACPGSGKTTLLVAKLGHFSQ